MTNTNKNSLQKEVILSKKVGLMDKYNFYEYIAVMLDGGVGVTDALESVHSKITSPYFRSKLQDLISFVSSGDSFSRAMKKVPSVFEQGEVSMIEAGETTGELSTSLLKLSDDLKKVYELKKKVKGALTYPLIIIIFLVLGIGVVMTFVVRPIMTLFEDAEMELPGATKALIATSDFMVNNYILLFLLLAVIVVSILIVVNTKTGKLYLEKKLINFPLVGKVYKNYILAKIASTLGNLVGSGVPIVKSLLLTGKATNSKVYQNAFDEITDHVREGNGIIKSMEDADPEKYLFPADYLQMLSVGEKTANMEEISKKLNKQYEKEVDYSLASMTKWIEPIAVGFAGIFITWFALAIFGAILRITDTVG